ncbi:hypothetical protein BJY04DRAFT_127555 [Aspergillus karnatakaensis]|uniref:uncharacterized protein n=1 Tax=Aspergillus karnatakaensis TaxID=1810916 RepID=UPI003CCD7DD5
MDHGFFPQFTDGAVTITVRPDIYHLQSSVLKNCSEYLRQLLQGHPASAIPLRGKLRHVNLNLVGSSVHRYGMLEVQGYEDSLYGSEGLSPCSFPVWPPAIRHLWSNVMKIFSNIHPVLDNNGYDSILGNCQALIQLGEELHSSEVISRTIRETLIGFDQQLYRLIAEDPVSWIVLGVRIQSVAVFQESMIHLVGKWGLLEQIEREALPRSIRILCEQKLYDLNATKIAVEERIVNHIPRPRFDRAGYRETNNVFVWMALTFYQQWLCQSFLESRNYRAPDGGAAFYRAIAAGGDAYLSKIDQEIARFPTVNTSGTSTKGLKELEKNLNELKKGTKGLVSELLVNQAKYDPDILGELPYLTCCKFDDVQMPLPETQAMSYQIEGMSNLDLSMTGNIPNDISQDTLYPVPMLNGIESEKGMMYAHNPSTDSLVIPGIQNDPSLNAFNTYNMHNLDPFTWGNSVDFRNPHAEALIPIMPEITKDFYQSQYNQDNYPGGMDIFSVSPITESDGPTQDDMHMQSDGNMAPFSIRRASDDVF